MTQPRQMTPASPRQAVEIARDQIQAELNNAKAYLTKAIEEKRQTQAKADALQTQIDVFDAWLAANP